MPDILLIGRSEQGRSYLEGHKPAIKKFLGGIERVLFYTSRDPDVDHSIRAMRDIGINPIHVGDLCHLSSDPFRLYDALLASDDDSRELLAYAPFSDYITHLYVRSKVDDGGVIYIGEGAGSDIAGPRTLDGEIALGIVPFVVDTTPEGWKERARTYHERYEDPVVGLTGRIEISREGVALDGKAEVFIKDHDPYPIDFDGGNLDFLMTGDPPASGE